MCKCICLFILEFFEITLALFMLLHLPLIAGSPGPLIKVYAASAITKGSKSDNHISVVEIAKRRWLSKGRSQTQVADGGWHKNDFQYSSTAIKTIANFC